MYRVASTLTPAHGSSSNGGSGGLFVQSAVHIAGTGSPGARYAPQRDAAHPYGCKNGGRIAHMSTSSLSQAQQCYCCPLMVEVCQYGCPGAPAARGAPLSREGLLKHCGLPPGVACSPAGCCTASHTPGSGRAACWLCGCLADGSSDGPAGETWSNRRNSTGCAAAQGPWPRA